MGSRAGECLLQSVSRHLGGRNLPVGRMLLQIFQDRGTRLATAHTPAKADSIGSAMPMEIIGGPGIHGRAHIYVASCAGLSAGGAAPSVKLVAAIEFPAIEPVAGACRNCPCERACRRYD